MVTGGPVVVIGGGVVGLAVAYRLRREGFPVTVIDRMCVGSGAARTNAGWLTPSLSEPVPSPASLGVGLRSLLRRDAPLAVHASLRPEYLAFLLQLLHNCRPTAYHRGLEASATLATQSLRAFDNLISDGVSFEHHERGVLLAFLEERTRDHYAADLASLTTFGVEAAVALSPAELAAQAPALSDAVTGGLLCPADRHVDPVSLVEALEIACRAADVEIAEHQTVTAISRTTTGVTVTTRENTFDARSVVITAGADSGTMAKLVGARLPVQGGKGYVLDLPTSVPRAQPVYLSEAKIAVSPLDDRLRLAGVMEFGARDTRVRRRRVESIMAGAQRYFAEPLNAPREVSAGMRPMTPDGLPIIGPLSDDGRVLVATGHGMLGVTLAPLTAELILSAITGSVPPADPTAFSPRRFSAS